MVAIVAMGVVVDATKPEINKMGGDDGEDGRDEEPEMDFVPDLLGEQQSNANYKQDYGQGPVVVPAEAVRKGIESDDKGNPDHAEFKCLVFNDVYAKNGQAPQQQRQHRTVDGAGHRGSNSESIPV